MTGPISDGLQSRLSVMWLVYVVGAHLLGNRLVVVAAPSLWLEGARGPSKEDDGVLVLRGMWIVILFETVLDAKGN